MGNGNTEADIELLRQTVVKWGRDANIGQLYEEMGELMVAINKFLRAQDTRWHIAEEVADVEICLDVICLIFGIGPEEIEKKRQDKLRRTKARLESGYTLR